MALESESPSRGKEDLSQYPIATANGTFGKEDFFEGKDEQKSSNSFYFFTLYDLEINL